MEDIYPAGPATVPAALTQPSATYKQRAWLAMASLLFFIIVYLALTAWFCWTAYRLGIEGLAGGDDSMINLVGSGLAAFLALFMLKALAFKKTAGESRDVEVTPEQQPRLFEFLYKLADEAGAPRPKRVFVSARVNAAVFYDLSIVNLLFPSRKNLEIGLALVNVLSLSEMKAVLAHEFGHFAQRSMAIGSWVYIAQQIAEQIVARRDALDRFLRALSRFDLRVAWIGWLLSLIVWSIRSLMDTLLRLVVLAQRALSRQMEFQADLVAVSLTGSDELVHALHKLQAGDEAWNSALNFAGSQIGQKRATFALFNIHRRIIEKLARITGDEHYGRVPPAPFGQAAQHRVFKTGFAQPPQMWSTHPANADREENAKRHYLAAAHDERSAWLLFDDVDGLRKQVLERLYNDPHLQPATEAESLAELDEYYAVLRYDPRYRGAYLGRALTRHASSPDELYDTSTLGTNLQQALKKLYTQELADDLSRLRELEEEEGGLKALLDKVYQPTGGRIVFRGREIARRDLPPAIQQVAQEAATVRERILAHDRQARGVHLAAAAQMGGGWRDYLLGLIRTLHFAEHSLADLHDARGLFANVFAIVTADGKVSSRELKRLIEAANTLHEVLSRIHELGKAVQLDSKLCARLEIASWSQALGEFNLPPANKDNINDWIDVIDGWADSPASALSALYNATLDELLATESAILAHVEAASSPDPAPRPTVLPDRYRTLLPGQERKRQKRLGLWDRFQTAEGFLPACARLVVALGIVGAVLAYGSVAGSVATVSVYNGLGVPITVDIAGQPASVLPFSAVDIQAELENGKWISARTSKGEEIERFQPEIAGHAQHYVYNIAGASPLVEWTAAYGSAAEREPIKLGLRRWMASSADIHFSDPPQTVSTKGGGATRTVLSGMPDEDPDRVLAVLESQAERQRVTELHARWDGNKTEHARRWKELAAGR